MARSAAGVTGDVLVLFKGAADGVENGILVELVGGHGLFFLVFLGGLPEWADQDAAFGALDDLDHGSGPGGADAGADRDRDAEQVVGQGSGLAAEDGPPGTVGELGGMPAGDGVRGRELAVKGFGDDAAQPGRDVDVAFFTQLRQPLAQLGIDAALDVFIALHYMTWYGFSLGNATAPGSFAAFPQGSIERVATPAHHTPRNRLLAHRPVALRQPHFVALIVR